jgi:UPF0755 protein
VALLLDDQPSRPAKSGPAGPTFLVVLGLALVLVVGLGAVVVRSVFGGGPADYAGSGHGQVVVQVREGDSASDIAATLLDADVVKSSGAFRNAADDEPKSRTIQPGFYRLRLQMKASAALTLMLDPTSRVRSRVVLPEGITLEQILARVAAGTEIKAADLQRAAARPAALGLPAFALNKGLEGLIFPATYDIEPGTTAVEALTMMVERFERAADDVGLEGGARALGRTPYEVLVIASLVEAEAKHDEDRGKVARVIYNRLARGMPLQLDATINYVLKARKVDILYKDLAVESEYNTYRNRGLPPGPINSPGAKSLRAALEPSPGNWLYFITVDASGRTEFTESYDEFLRLKAQAKGRG